MHAGGLAQPAGQHRITPAGVYRPRVASRRAAPAQDKIGLARQHWAAHAGELGKVEGSVSVHKAHNVGLRREQPGVRCRTKAPLWHMNHLRAQGAGNFGRAVSGPVVGDNRPVPIRKAGQYRGQCPGLIQAGKHDINHGFNRMAECPPMILTTLLRTSHVSAKTTSLGSVRILLTGSAGFIGSHIGHALRAAGHDVVGLDCLLPAAHGHAAASGVPGLTIGDVRDAATVRAALRGIDAVCHQAAMVGMGIDMADAPQYASCNDVGTAVVLAEMTAAGVGHLVLASSMVVYGEGAYECAAHGAQRPASRSDDDLRAGQFEPGCPVCGAPLTPSFVDESAPLEPRSVYAATKLAQEHLAGAWARATGATAVALRYHNVYGPHMPRDTPYAGVAAIFRSSLERGQAPQVFEDGGQRRDFIHVDDIAAANVLALLNRDHAPGGLTAYNIATGSPRTILDMATELARATNGPAPQVTGRYRGGDVRHITASPLLARKHLGFSASTAFVSGVAAFATAPLRAPAGLAAQDV